MSETFTETTAETPVEAMNPTPPQAVHEATGDYEEPLDSENNEVTPTTAGSNGTSTDLMGLDGTTSAPNSAEPATPRGQDSKDPEAEPATLLGENAPPAVEPASAVPSAGSPPPPYGTPYQEVPPHTPLQTGLRLRLKVWTDPHTHKRYLMPMAFMRDVVKGLPVSDVMYAHAMGENETKLLTFRVAEWNALPFFYFQEDGAAPRTTARTLDVRP